MVIRLETIKGRLRRMNNSVAATWQGSHEAVISLSALYSLLRSSLLSPVPSWGRGAGGPGSKGLAGSWGQN